MSYKCEHAKDSDGCVECWEERNLKLRIMNEPTELQKAVDSTALRVDHAEYEDDEFDLFKVSQVKELLSAAKQLSALQKENEDLQLKLVNRNSWARKVQQAAKVLEQERDSLTAALKECAEALVEADKCNDCSACRKRIASALSNPLVQKLLKP